MVHGSLVDGPISLATPIFGILFIDYVKIWWRNDSVVAITYTNGENTNIDFNLFHSKTYNPISPYEIPI